MLSSVTLTSLSVFKSKERGAYQKSPGFTGPLTHVSSVPEGGVEWLLVMLEQVPDVCKAFDLEDLRFLLDDFPAGGGFGH